MRKLAGLGTILVLVLGLAAPVAAEHAEEVEGLWAARDIADGSLMLLTVREIDDDGGIIAANFVDFWATGACVPPSVFVARDVGELYDDGAASGMKLLHFEFTGTNTRCLGGSHVSSDVFGTMTLKLRRNGTLRDVSNGQIWRRISA